MRFCVDVCADVCSRCWKEVLNFLFLLLLWMCLCLVVSVGPSVVAPPVADAASPAATADSLFDFPGILEVPHAELSIPLVTDAYRYDLSAFHAQVVPNHVPFAFDQTLVQKHAHAQHKLRAVTYNYGPRYADDYVMKHNGLFIERHDFIQCITPMHAQCGGFAFVGREVPAEAAPGSRLELVAITIPFGYTLLVDSGCLHGDSTLTGMYLMAMTGNHVAMGTADTVFLKHAATKRNARAVPVPFPPAPTPAPAPPARSAAESAAESAAAAAAAAAPAPLPLLLTSDQLPLAQLHAHDAALKASIAASMNALKALVWQPVIMTSASWTKTRGTHLPAL